MATFYQALIEDILYMMPVKPIERTEPWSKSIIDTHHEKTDLKAFVVVIPKEGSVGRDGGPLNPSLGMAMTKT